MRLRTVPFDRTRHLDAAAALLAARHRRDRMREPRLPARFEGAAACKPLVEEALAPHGAIGAVAEATGDPMAFAIMSPTNIDARSYNANFIPLRFAAIGYTGYAAREEVAFDALRELYATLAEHFVARGYFDHIAWVAPSDAAVCDAFESLGFGRGMAAAVRGVDPLDRPSVDAQLHLAGMEDLDQVLQLYRELLMHHTRSPIFVPFVEEAWPSVTQFQQERLAEPAGAHWLAVGERGEALGMNTFIGPGWVSPMIAPEGVVYLFQGVVSERARRGGLGAAILQRGIAWARERGYQHVALHYATANIPGARFWQSNGFRPVEYRYHRRVDTRIAWADR